MFTVVWHNRLFDCPLICCIFCTECYLIVTASFASKYFLDEFDQDTVLWHFPIFQFVFNANAYLFMKKAYKYCFSSFICKWCRIFILNHIPSAVHQICMASVVFCRYYVMLLHVSEYYNSLWSTADRAGQVTCADFPLNTQWHLVLSFRNCTILYCKLIESNVRMLLWQFQEPVT